jgi:23S rRNA (pseudouridine1915-N3)-methyltransferase
MKVTLLAIGKTEESYLREGISEYEGRIRRYASFELREVPAVKTGSGLPVAAQKKKEAEVLRRHFTDADVVVLLDEHGREMGSVQFAEFLNRQFLSGKKNMVFLTGGPFGFDEALKTRADFTLSLSRMTFSHQMVRLIFAEQLYRALTILKNENYHHE